jgi:homoserine kinase
VRGRLLTGVCLSFAVVAITAGCTSPQAGNAQSLRVIVADAQASVSRENAAIALDRVLLQRATAADNAFLVVSGSRPSVGPWNDEASARAVRKLELDAKALKADENSLQLAQRRLKGTHG